MRSCCSTKSTRVLPGASLYQRASEPICAGELIVVDIFPRRIEDGYWGDMTRTYLKGQASDAQRRLVHTVKKAHRLAIDMIKPGVTGGMVHVVPGGCELISRAPYKWEIPRAKLEMDLYDPKLITVLATKLTQLHYADALALWGLAGSLVLKARSAPDWIASSGFPSQHPPGDF